MRLIICRHGETKANALGEIQGHRPGELTEKGIQQAKQLAIRLSEESFDAIYCSDLKRAKDTVLQVVAHHETPVSFDEALRERAWGELEGHPFEELFGPPGTPRGPEWLKFVPPKGESLTDLRNRAERFIATVLTNHDPDETILLTAHHSINKMLMMCLLKWPLEDWEKLAQGNTCVNILEGELGGEFVAHALNCMKHLERTKD